MKPAPITLLLLLVAAGAARAQNIADQFPEAPQPVKHAKYGGYEIDQARIEKPRPLFTKTWVGAHVLYLGSMAFDAEMTHQGQAHHNCQEGNIDLGPRPSRGELYRKNLLEEYLPLTAMDLLFQAVWRGDGQPKAWKWVPLIGAGYGSAVHLRGGIQWASCF